MCVCLLSIHLDNSVLMAFSSTTCATSFVSSFSLSFLVVFFNSLICARDKFFKPAELFSNSVSSGYKLQTLFQRCTTSSIPVKSPGYLDHNSFKQPCAQFRKSAYFPYLHLTVTFYYRQGTYPSRQGYSNSHMNRYILEAIATPIGQRGKACTRRYRC